MVEPPRLKNMLIKLDHFEKKKWGLKIYIYINGNQPTRYHTFLGVCGGCRSKVIKFLRSISPWKYLRFENCVWGSLVSPIWVSKNRGKTPQIINSNRVFPYFHHPFWGVKLKFEGIPSTTRKEGLHHTNKIKAKALKPF